jgi:hypothetical protein
MVYINQLYIIFVKNDKTRRTHHRRRRKIPWEIRFLEQLGRIIKDIQHGIEYTGIV